MIRSQILAAITVAAFAVDVTNHRLRRAGAIVTFSAADEHFRVWLTDRDQIDAAHAPQAGGTARIPNGRVVSGTQVNTGWNWHLEDVSLPKAKSNSATARRSDVEQQGARFGVGRVLLVVCHLVDTAVR